MITIISVVGGFTPPFPQEPRVGIDDIVIPKYLNSCQACTITPPTYLDREFKWNIYIHSGIYNNYESDCENHSNNSVNLCPPTFEEIYSDPITFIITTSAYRRQAQPVTCIKKVICQSP
jgi:hypothetical protein